jgi:hypothetical protein
MEACEENLHFFTPQRNVTNLISFSAHPKIFVAMRVTAYRIPADYTYEYLHIGKDSTLKYVRLFAKTLICVFADTGISELQMRRTRRG